jgi:SAM-dependent methyltransferase
MKLFRKALALLTWIVFYVPSTMFVMLVMGKEYLRLRKTKTQNQANLDRSDRETLIRFVERNVTVAPRDMDEGIGTVYERVLIDEFLRRLQITHSIQNVLESPADGVTGVPGVMSLEFARNSGTVALTNPVPRMLDCARQAWERGEIADRVKLVHCEVDATPFDDNSFDLVWNYCMFERFSDPSALVSEMKRVSRRYIMIMTQNSYNFGTPFHKIYHAMSGMEWDHGYNRQMTMAAIRRAVVDQGLQIEEEGEIDIPPWLDTWDMPLRGAMKQILAMVGKKWEWKIDSETVSSANGQPSSSKMINFFRGVELNLPQWFRRYQAHHLYVLARK